MEAISSHRESAFIDDFGYGVVDFFNNDLEVVGAIDSLNNNWSVENLENELEEAVDVVCYVNEKLEELRSDGEQGIFEDPEFLDRFYDIALNELDDNPEIYDWVLNSIEDIANLIDYLGVFPDGLGNKLETATTVGKNITQFVPLVANLKQIVGTGCDIYDEIHMGESPAESTYVEFFKHVALTIIEVILLATGTVVGYRVAFGATGWANRRLINVVGRRIGWRAYSWVLSQIHWGARISFAEGMGQAISDVTETVSQQLVSVSADAGNPLSKSEALEIVKSDVKTMAEHTDGWSPDYELWELKQWMERERRQASQRVDQIEKQIGDFLES